MDKPFARLNRAFRALAALERIDCIKNISFKEVPTVTITLEAFREYFPEVTPASSGEYGDLYVAPFFGMEVLAWDRK